MKNNSLQDYFFACVFALSCFVGTANAALEIEITGGGAQQIPIAVVPFGQENALKTQLSKVVSDDLRRSGLFKLLQTRGVAQLPTNANEINLAQWQALQAQAMSVGNVQALGGNRYKVSFQLVDVLKQTILTSLEYTVTPKQLRMLGHKIADQIYSKLTGEGGMFASRIAYIVKTKSRYYLKVADSDGANAKTLASSREPIISPKWSPDGLKVAYVSFEQKKPVIYIQWLFENKRTVLANYKGNNSAPAWSPDGKKLAIVLTYGGNSQVYTINADGSGVKQLVRSYGIDTEPTWSADGRWIYFTSDRGGRPQIYKVPSQGGEALRVTYDGRYNVSPRLSPGDRYLATIRNEDGRYLVALQDLANGQVQLLSEGAKDESPSFSPNGRVILYAASRGGRGNLASVSVDGAVKQKLRESSGDVREPAWGPLIK